MKMGTVKYAKRYLTAKVNECFYLVLEAFFLTEVTGSFTCKIWLPMVVFLDRLNGIIMLDNEYK
jgi:hypothetical protein